MDIKSRLNKRMCSKLYVLIFNFMLSNDFGTTNLTMADFKSAKDAKSNLSTYKRKESGLLFRFIFYLFFTPKV